MLVIPFSLFFSLSPLHLIFISPGESTRNSRCCVQGEWIDLRDSQSSSQHRSYGSRRHIIKILCKHRSGSLSQDQRISQRESRGRGTLGYLSVSFYLFSLSFYLLIFLSLCLSRACLFLPCRCNGSRSLFSLFRFHSIFPLLYSLFSTKGTIKG